MRGWFAGILLTVVMVTGMAATARAAEDTGTVSIVLSCPETVKQGAVTFWKAAEAADGGYRLTEDYGGGIVKKEDVSSEELARWMAKQSGEGGITKLLDADGRAEVTDLSPGLYLVCQTEEVKGYYAMEPFLVEVDGTNRQYTFPLSYQECPQTGQPSAPILWAMLLVASGLGLLAVTEKRE